MQEIAFLRDFVIILGIAVIVVAALHRLKIPSIAGFILAGMLVGPESLGLVSDIHQVELLAEIGVVLLLFSIGLELSLDRLRRLWFPILIGGSFQVGLTILITFVIGRLLNYPFSTALVIGFIVAVSSTAIVLRGLEEKREVDAPHGRLTLGILIFQDLCVVPMMLAIPVLGTSNSLEPGSQNIFSTALEAIAIIAGVLLSSRLIVPRILDIVARTRQRHLFVLSVLLICIGTAWLTSSAGVSLALGAFLAGLIVAGSEYRHQATADMIPFKDVFTSIFFISIGMLLIPRDVFGNIGLIFMLLAVILVGKFLIIFLIGVILRLPIRVAVLTGVALCQIGEFSFLLTKTAQDTGLINNIISGNLVAAAIISMFITPFALAFGPHIAAGAGRIRILTRIMRVAAAEDCVDEKPSLKDHVIIGGYGYAGKKLAQILKELKIPYIIVDLNAENVRQAAAGNEPAYFGDLTSTEVLEKLNIADAKEFVIVINDPNAIERAVKAARIITSRVHIVVRTNYLLDINSLKAAGANEIIAGELETALEVVVLTLNTFGVERAYIAEKLKKFREKDERN
jgi:CPA2 family monovalent cation:H+ antiporter-2